MKFFYTFCLLLVVCFSNAQTIQHYHPMLNCFSRYLLKDANSGFDRYWWLTEMGDSIINGITYKKIIYTDTFGNSSQPLWFGREDTLGQKIYMYDTASQTDQLMVDFSVSIGDTTQIYYDAACLGPVFNRAIVTNIQYVDTLNYIVFRNGKRKLITYTPLNINTIPIMPTICEEYGLTDVWNPFDCTDLCNMSKSTVLSMFHLNNNSAEILPIFSNIQPAIPSHLLNGCSLMKYGFIQATICYGDSFYFKQQFVSNSGIYIDTLTSLSGLDSILSLNLIIKPIAHSIFTFIPECNGISYTKVDTFKNSIGCDSIYHNNVHQQVLLDTSLVFIHDTLKVNINTNCTFHWKDCSINTLISNQNNSTFAPSKAGSYAVVIFDTINGCIDSSKCFNISLNGENGLLNATFNLFIYPNPVSNLLTVSSNQFTVNAIEVTDMLGRIQNVKVEKITSENCQLNTENLPLGIYFIKATDNFGNSLIGKFVKE